MADFEVMGIVNVTPDSFSDGGRWLDPQAAIEHGLLLAAQGATILDIGGESTRPGAAPVGPEEELHRVIPVIEGLAREGAAGARISIDTAKAYVAERALDAGAEIVNDVTALGDPRMASVVADAGCDLCLMHMLGEPRTMQDDPSYEGDVVDRVAEFLIGRLELAKEAGIDEERIWLDPGIGFGKTVQHNLELLKRLNEIVAIGRPVLLGTSRKRFIAAVSGGDVQERLPGSLASIVMAFERGASIFRVHDVAESVAALEVAAATLRGSQWRSGESA